MQIRGAPYLAEHNYSSLKGDSLMAAKKLRAHEVIATQGALVTLPPVVTLQTLLDQLHRYTFGAFAVTPDAPTAENPAFPLHGAITRIRLLRMCQYRIGILVRCLLCLAVRTDARRLDSTTGERGALMHTMREMGFVMLHARRSRAKIPSCSLPNATPSRSS